MKQRREGDASTDIFHLIGLSTSHPSVFFISSGSSSNKIRPPPPPPPLLIVLRPVPVLGGSAGFTSSSIRFGIGFLAAELDAAIDRLGGGGSGLDSSPDGLSRYDCNGVLFMLVDAEEEPGDAVIETREDFLLGIGGGTFLRKTCGLFAGSGGGCDVSVLDARYGNAGRERADALDSLRLKLLSGSRAPSRLAT